MTHSVPTKAFLQTRTRALSPKGDTYPPLPVPPFLLALQEEPTSTAYSTADVSKSG